LGKLRDKALIHKVLRWGFCWGNLGDRGFAGNEVRFTPVAGRPMCGYHGMKVNIVY
jgi:hypothetical protein